MCKSKSYKVPIPIIRNTICYGKKQVVTNIFRVYLFILYLDACNALKEKIIS